MRLTAEDSARSRGMGLAHEHCTLTQRLKEKDERLCSILNSLLRRLSAGEIWQRADRRGQVSERSRLRTHAGPTHVGIGAALALNLLLLGSVLHDVDDARAEGLAVVSVRRQVEHDDDRLERRGRAEVLEALVRQVVVELRGDEDERQSRADVEVDREELVLKLTEGEPG